MSLAALSLAALVVQNALVVLMTRHSRIQSLNGGPMYHSSTLIVMQEIVKFLICLFLFRRDQSRARRQRLESGALSSSTDNHTSSLSSSQQQSPLLSADLMQIFFSRETMKIAVPAALFTLQNFLLFVALSHLDVMTFQLLSQTKLLSAALFSVWFLDRHLSGMQWVSLVTLSAGVLLAQVQSVPLTKVIRGGGGGEGIDVAATALTSAATTVLHTVASSSSLGTTPGASLASPSFVLGATACLLSGLSSSFAGVYFEKVVKTTPPSLAIRNLQLGLFGIPMSVFSLVVLDSGLETLFQFDFWRGWSLFTWMLVLVHALGGLLVAVVVKYADNILKGFATALAVIASGLLARVIWGYEPTLYFVLGCALVLVSTVMYQWFAPRPAAQHSA